MEDIKKAFQRVKQDIATLNEGVHSTKNTLAEETHKISELCNIISILTEKTKNLYEDQQKTKDSLKEILDNLDNSKEFQALEKSFEDKINNLQEKILQRLPQEQNELSTQTDRHKKPTNKEDTSTDSALLDPLKPQNIPFSTRNEGVPTDRQTDRQTDRHIEKRENSLDNAVEILNSLDKVKKELRLKFKRLTDQEVLIFSTIYQLEEEQKETNYRTLSEKLKLSESSIRDYVGRLIKKGIPVEKHKINNKNIKLSISDNLKKIATLPTILQLREL